MSILTKALVVLVTMLSIVLVALVVPFVATQEDYQKDLKTEQALRRSADQAAKVAQTELSVAQQAIAKGNAQLQQTINTLTGQVEEEKAARAKAEAQAKAALDQLKGLEASYAAIAGTNDEKTKMIGLLGAQVQEARELNVQLGTQKLQMADRIDELTTVRDGLGRQVNQLQEQLVATNEELAARDAVLAQVPDDTLAAIKGAQDGKQLVEIVPDPPIAGQVTAVEAVSGDLKLVQINVGQADGVADGMKFLVHSGDTFKGTLIISRVEPRVAVGKLELEQGDILTGDEVYAGRY